MKAGRRKLLTSKYRLSSVLFAFLFLLPACVRAGYIDIYTDTIIDSNLGVGVYVYDSATLTMLSGSATAIQLLDTSICNVYGGAVVSYVLSDSSTLNLYGGVFNGYNNYVTYFSSSAKIYVYGQNFQIKSVSENDTSVILSGNWLDGTSFKIYFRGLPQSFYDALGTNIFLVPEPATMLLMIVGALGFKKLKH